MKPVEEIRNEDWDFSNCPKDQQSFCFFYEYARELFIHLREQEGNKWTRKTFFRSFQKNFPVQIELQIGIRKTFASELSKLTAFPGKSFLELSDDVRAKLMDKNVLKCNPNIPGLVQQDFVRIPHDKETFNMFASVLGFTPPGQTSLAAFMPFLSTGVVPQPQRISVGESMIEFGIIQINWSASPKQLAKSFQEWVRKKRPESAKPFKMPTKEVPKQFLKYLAAKRLLDKMSAEKASVFTKNAKGKPLYWESNDWYAARREARQIQSHFFQPFFETSLLEIPQ